MLHPLRPDKGPVAHGFLPGLGQHGFRGLAIKADVFAHLLHSVDARLVDIKYYGRAAGAGQKQGGAQPGQPSPTITLSIIFSLISFLDNTAFDRNTAD